MDEECQILISWINEYAYCKRRFYLKALERQESSNTFLTEGTIKHQSVDKARIEKRKDTIHVYGMEVNSKAYNLYGKCDSVEFKADANGPYIPFLNGKYSITPVEFKHGKLRNEKEYNLQLMAQIMCLEEMFGCSILNGHIYYTDAKNRFEVKTSEEARNDVIRIAGEISELLNKPMRIAPVYKKRCLKCSVYNICAPRENIVKAYMESLKEKYYGTGR